MVKIYIAWPKKKVVHFEANCSVMILLQLVRSRHSKSAEFLNVLNDHVIPSMDFSSLMARAYSWKTMPRLIGLLLWKSGAWGHMSFREHEESFSSHMNWPPQSPDFAPLKDFGMCWKRLEEWFNSPAINKKSRTKTMQLWMEINVWHCIRFSKQCHSKCAP